MSKKFSGMGGVNPGMLKQVQKMQEDMLKAQEELEAKTYTASVGGGAVKATVTGKKQLTEIVLSPDAVDPAEVEMLQDLVLSAVNEALRQAEDDMSQGMRRFTGGLNLPF